MKDGSAIKSEAQARVCRVLVKTDGYQINHHLPKFINYPNVIVVTFGIIHGGLKRTGFATEFLNKLGIENIYVAHSKRSFYQKLSATELQVQLAPLISGKRVITYGSSLGAYAALYYAGVLNAKALALSPMCSADPKLKPPKNKYPAFVHQPFEQIKISDQTPLIAYDPLMRRDKLYVEQVISLAYPHADRLALPNGMHSVSLSLQASGQLKAFFMHGLLHEGVPDISINPLLDKRYCIAEAKKQLRADNVSAFQQLFEHALTMGQSVDLFRLTKEAFYAQALKSYPTDLKAKAFVLDKLKEKRQGLMKKASGLQDYLAADIGYFTSSLQWSAALERLELACQLLTGDAQVLFIEERARLQASIKYYKGATGI